MTHGSRRGMAIPLALFIVMVLVLMVTVTAEQARENLRYTGLDAAQLQRRHLARGACSEAVAQMRRDPGWEKSHTSTSPRTWTQSGVRLKAWAEPMPAQGMFKIRGVAHPPGQPAQAEQYTRVVWRGPVVHTVTYVDAEGEYYYVNGNKDDEWIGIPRPYNLTYYRTAYRPNPLDPEGPPLPYPHKYVSDDPDYNAFGSKRTYADYGKLGPFTADQEGNLLAQFIPDDPEGLPTMLIYNAVEETWEVELLSGPDERRQVEDLVGGFGQRLYAAATDGLDPGRIQNERLRNGILYYERPRDSAATGYHNPLMTATNWWSRIESPEGVSLNARVTQLADGGAYPPPKPGEPPPPPERTERIFVTYSEDPKRDQKLFVMDQKEGWSELPRPPAIYFDEEGELVRPEGAPPVLLDKIVASPKGDLYGLWKRDGLDMVYKLSLNSNEPFWSPMAPLRAFRKKRGDWVPTGAFIPDIDELAVTVDGELQRQVAEGPGEPGKIYGSGDRPLEVPRHLQDKNLKLLATGGLPVAAGGVSTVGHGY